MYEKYKVTTWGRLENDDDKMTVFVEPWELHVFLNTMLDNCKVVKIDGGIKAKPEEDEDVDF